MPVEMRKTILRKDVRKERDKLFVFGDNFQRWGLGGQAREMRGESNAVGLPTKIAPGMQPDDFLMDRDLGKLIGEVGKDVARISAHLLKGGWVVWPGDGIGSRIECLAEKAPKIKKYYDDLLAGFTLIKCETDVDEAYVMTLDHIRNQARMKVWQDNPYGVILWLLAYIDATQVSSVVERKVESAQVQKRIIKRTEHVDERSQMIVRCTVEEISMGEAARLCADHRFVGMGEDDAKRDAPVGMASSPEFMDAVSGHEAMQMAGVRP